MILEHKHTSPPSYVDFFLKKSGPFFFYDHFKLGYVCPAGLGKGPADARYRLGRKLLLVSL